MHALFNWILACVILYCLIQTLSDSVSNHCTPAVYEDTCGPISTESCLREACNWTGDYSYVCIPRLFFSLMERLLFILKEISINRDCTTKTAVLDHIDNLIRQAQMLLSLIMIAPVKMLMSYLQ